MFFGEPTVPGLLRSIAFHSWFTKVSLLAVVSITLPIANITNTSIANAAPNPIEIISITESSITSVEILFSSNVPKKQLSYYVINAAIELPVAAPQNSKTQNVAAIAPKKINKVIKTKASGLITTVIKDLNPKAIYNFSVSAKTNKGKMISSAPMEYSPLSNLMDLLSNLPADWGNPKPIQLPTPAPTAAPTAAPTVISVAAIAGVTAPITGGTPVATTTAGTGYTGTVSWSGTPTTFASVTTYTATITLTPTSGYSLTGVAADFFTVAGATSNTNPANSGVVTAVFPATAAGPAAKVAITQASVGTSPGVAFTTQPQITIQDSGGNTITSSTAVVTATVSTGGTLVGTATATASSGVATFSNLGIRGFGGTAYTITYTAAGLNTATQSVTPSALTVGNTGPGGGKIFYVATSTGFNCGPTLNEKCYYLEAASTTATTNPWTDVLLTWSTGGNQSISVPTATGTAIGTGYKNSLAIVAQTGNLAASSAAVTARDYGGPNALTDWFLPSKDELIQLYHQRTVVGGLVVTSGYWSSTEYSAGNGVYFTFPSGFWWYSPKASTNIYVRPVRAF